MISEILPSLKLFLGLTLLTGVIYPALVTGIAQIFFPKEANGSFVVRENKIMGSELIAQEFKGPKFFRARSSAVGFNPMPSGGSNLAPTSADLLKAIQERKAAGDTDDLLFTSASGLDPEISPAAAASQIKRVSLENQIPIEILQKLVEKHQKEKTFGFLGEPRVNVLLLNLDVLEAASVKR